jgi:hypothetical protein
MDKLISEWKATATGEGEGRTIHLVGDGEAPTAGFKLELKPGNEGFWNDPDRVAIELTVKEPHGEVAQVVTPTHVEMEIHDPAIHIRIDTPWGEEWEMVA